MIVLDFMVMVQNPRPKQMLKTIKNNQKQNMINYYEIANNIKTELKKLLIYTFLI